MQLFLILYFNNCPIIIETAHRLLSSRVSVAIVARPPAPCIIAPPSDYLKNILHFQIFCTVGMSSQ